MGKARNKKISLNNAIDCIIVLSLFVCNTIKVVAEGRTMLMQYVVQQLVDRMRPCLHPAVLK